MGGTRGCARECEGSTRVCKGSVRECEESARKREGVRGSVRECKGVWGSTGGVHAHVLIGCCEYY